MKGDVQDAGNKGRGVTSSQTWLQSVSSSSPVIVLKHVLCPVAVVNVPVQDKDSQRQVTGQFLGMAGGKSCRVEETEAAGKIPLCVMTRRPDNGHGVPHLCTQLIDYLNVPNLA